jgi:hypothetical protein
MLPDWTTVGFSGHRRLKDPLAVASAIDKIFARLEGDYEPLTTVSSAASGADTLFLETVSKRNLPFRLILPFQRDLFEKDFDGAEWQRVLPFFSTALAVQELSSTESRGEAFLETGIATVEAADVMIFVWDGQPAHGIGGTADIVAYARSLTKPLIIIDSDNGQITNEEHLKDISKPAKSVSKLDNPRIAVEDEFQTFRKRANQHAPIARHLITWVIVLQLVAAAIGIIGMSDQGHWLAERALGTAKSNAWIWSLPEELVLIVAIALVGFHHKLQHGWIESRLRTELCRSFIAVWDFPRSTRFFPDMALRGCGKLSHNLQIAWCLDRGAARGFDEARDTYLANRIRGQRQFFERAYNRARDASRRLSRVAWLAAIIAIGFAVISPWLPWAHIFSVILPMASAGLWTLLVSKEHTRRGVLYHEMAATLSDLDRRLEATRSWSGLFRLAQEAEDCLLREVAEWYSFARFTAVLH